MAPPLHQAGGGLGQHVPSNRPSPQAVTLMALTLQIRDRSHRLLANTLLVLAASVIAAADSSLRAQQPAPAKEVKPASEKVANALAQELQLQVALDRAGYAVGVIDGRIGRHTMEALRAFQRTRSLPETGKADPATGDALGLAGTDATTSYHVTDADVAGPFVPEIPEDLVEQGNLPALMYTSVTEMLAERFHTSEDVLKRLNPTAQFTPGESIVVPNVEPLVLPSETQRRNEPGPEADRTQHVLVTKRPSALRVVDAAGAIVFFAPVTSGSSHDPLPIGTWKVTDVYLNPRFNYNPDLFWDARPGHAKTVLKPGPNNPVGVAWIDLSKEHYGMHGTPFPETIGRTASHGCIRLTNWDVLRVARFVKPGTTVIFQPTLTETFHQKPALTPSPVSEARPDAQARR
jgi:lipoprotein-anchoring transpeptidase ErfK/SrfK